MLSNKKKHYLKKIRPGASLAVSGPCEFTLKEINKFNQAEISFNLDSNVIVTETSKDYKNERSKN